MAAREVSATMRFQADFSDLDAALNNKIQQITRSAVNVPVSQNFGGPLGGSGSITSTIGGTPIPGGLPSAATSFGAGVAGASSPNFSFFGAQIARDVSSAVSEAIREGTRAATRSVNLRAGGREETGGPLGLTEEGAGIRSRAFSWASQWDRVDTAIKRAKLSQNLARTAGTYGDPSAALDEAISEGAAMEQAAYPGAIAAANARRSGGGGGLGGALGGFGSSGLLSRGPFRRIAGRFAGAYAVYAGIQELEASIRGSQEVSLASEFGGQSEIIAAKQRSYERRINAAPLTGPLIDAVLGGIFPGRGTAGYERIAAQEREAQGRSQGEIENSLSVYRSRLNVEQAQNAAARIETRNPYRQRIEDIEAGRQQRIREDDLHEEQLRFGVVYAQRHGSREERREARTRLQTFQYDRPREFAAFEGLARAQEQEIDRDETTAIRVANQEMRGFTHAARITELESRRTLTDRAARPTPLLAGAAGFLPLPGGLTGLPGFGGDPRDPNALVDAQVRLENTRFRWEREDVRRAQDTEERQIGALMNRDPTGAEVFGISGRTLQTYEHLTRTDKPEEAVNELKIGVSRLELSKFEYLNAFHGQQINPFAVDLTATRNTEDPTTILKEINDEIKALNAKLKIVN